MSMASSLCMLYPRNDGKAHAKTYADGCSERSVVSLGCLSVDALSIQEPFALTCLGLLISHWKGWTRMYNVDNAADLAI